MRYSPEVVEGAPRPPRSPSCAVDRAAPPSGRRCISGRKLELVDQILSVCSGIGGLDIGLANGLRRVGRSPRTVCMVEREVFVVSVLARAMQSGRMDDCPIWLGDVRDLPVDELPQVDWITGGYPCQPFSEAGKRLGEDDPRHLWPVIFEHVRALRPFGVFFENVGGHLTLGLDRVLRDLASCGFRCAFGLYTAAEIGAPHRRERVFVLGLADGDGGRLSGLGELHGESEDNRPPLREDACRCDEDVADGDESGLEGCQQPEPERAHEFPTRPGCAQGSDEPPRTIEPGMGRGAHGVPDRVDRLRALGNAVVPQQAEHAFVDLWKEMTRC